MEGHEEIQTIKILDWVLEECKRWRRKSRRWSFKF